MASSDSFSFGVRTSGDASPIHVDETPNRARIKVLSARIAGVDTDREVERQARHEAFGNKVREAEDELAKTQIHADGAFKLAKDKLGKLQESVATQRSALEILDDRQTKELGLFESNHDVDHKAERDERQENELKFEKAILERLESIQEEMVQECQAREADAAQRVKQLQEELGKVRGRFEAEKVRIENSDRILQAKSAGDIKDVEELLNAEIKVREETEKTMLKIIEESSNKLHIETQANRRSREETHESLLRILEQTCLSVEQSLGN